MNKVAEGKENRNHVTPGRFRSVRVFAECLAVVFDASGLDNFVRAMSRKKQTDIIVGYAKR